jgi:hypothetical protein
MSDTAPPSSSKKKRNSTLPVELESFTKDDLNCILIREETLEGGYSIVKKGEEHNVAYAVKLSDGEPYDITDRKLTLDMLRKLATNFGVTCASRMKKEEIRYTLAHHSNVASRVDAKNRKYVEHQKQRKFNTVVRLINTLFSDPFKDRLLSWNNARNRTEQEMGDGSKMQRLFEDAHSFMFPKEIAEMKEAISDEEDNNSDDIHVVEPQKGPDVLGTIDDFSLHKDLDKEKYEAYKQAHPNDPNNYNLTAPQELGNWTRKLIRTRKSIQSAMSQSGQHSDDYMDFVEKGLRQANAKSAIGIFPAYYFCLKADMVPEFDAKFQPFMNENLKGDSTDKFETSDEESVSSQQSGRKKTKFEEEMEGFFKSERQVNAEKSRMIKMEQCRMLQDDLQKIEDPSPLTGQDSRIYKRKKREYDNLIGQLYPPHDSDSD